MTNFFAPQFVYSKVVDARMPFILMAIFGFLASILALFLPETNGIKLPDTIEEAEVLFKRQGLFSWKSSKIAPVDNSIQLKTGATLENTQRPPIQPKVAESAAMGCVPGLVEASADRRCL